MHKQVILSVCLLLTFFNKPTFASGDKYPVGGRSSALANASVMLSDYWSLFHNQAGLASLNHMEAGIFHQNGIVRELSYQALGVAVPFDNGTLGWSCQYFGYSKYHEIFTGFTYAMQLGEHLAAAVQVDYLFTHLYGMYENSHFLTFEAGLIYKPVEKLRIGTHLLNPAGIIGMKKDQPFPSVFRMGAGYYISDELFVSTELEKDLEMPACMKFGVEYKLTDYFFLRTGFSTQPVVHSFGIGYEWNHFILDISVTRHNVLGYAPQCSVNYTFR